MEKFRGRRLIAVTASRRHGPKQRGVMLGSATATLSAGQTETVDVQLTSAASKLIAQRLKIPALLAITSPRGQLLWKQTVTLVARAQRKHGLSG